MNVCVVPCEHAILIVHFWNVYVVQQRVQLSRIIFRMNACVVPCIGMNAGVVLCILEMNECIVPCMHAILVLNECMCCSMHACHSHSISLNECMCCAVHACNSYLSKIKAL